MTNRGHGPKIVERLRAGRSYKEIVAELGCSISTVAHHAKNAGLAPGGPPRHDWGPIAAFYEAGASPEATIAHFCVYRQSWNKAVERGDITLRHPDTPEGIAEQNAIQARERQEQWAREALQQALEHGTNEDVVDALVAYDEVPRECSRCGLDSWNGQPLLLVAGYKRGLTGVNSADMLVLRCLNCETQVPRRTSIAVMTKRERAALGRDISVRLHTGPCDAD